MLNNVDLIGRFTAEPKELLKEAGGKKVINITLAVARDGKNTPTDFIPIVLWGNTADYAANYLKKGSLVAVNGRISTGSFENKDTGKKEYTFKVTVEKLFSLSTPKKADENVEVVGEPEVEEVFLVGSELPH